MRTTRRLLEPRACGLLFLLASVSLPGAATLSCAGDDAPDPSVNAGVDASIDASAESAATDAKGVAVIDASPLPIRCETPPCAIALTTTVEGAAGGEGYCALLEDRTVACWGANTSGQLGIGETKGVDSAVAVRVPGLSGITSIDHTCAVEGNGAVWCWGRGPFAGDASTSETVVGSPVAIDLPGPAAVSASGTDAACALLRDQSLYCWGSRPVILGESIYGTEYRPPTKVALPPGAKSISLGAAAFALYGDGTMLSWGANPGVGRTTSLQPDPWPSPVGLDRITMIDTSNVEACAVANGIGWCWGQAPSPAFGTAENPLQRALPTAVDLPEPITRIATSKTMSVAESEFEDRPRWCATSVSGAVYCWGLNDSGQAGDGTKNHATAPVRVAGLPAPAAEVKIMAYSTCSILTNGKVYCWGNNNYGQLGAGLPKGSVLTPSEVKLP